MYHVYVGTYGSTADEAIQLLVFNSKEETLEKLAGATGIKHPSYVTVNETQDQLYAVSEVEAGQVVNFHVDLAAATITEKSRQPTKGNAPCYLTMDEQGKHLLTVNYGEGTTIVHKLADDGSIGSSSDLKIYEGESQSHPHTIVNIPSTNKYIVTDLGLTKLYLYAFNEKTSKLELIHEIEAVAGSGPRHIAIEPVLKKMYVVNEFNSRISVYSYDEKVEEFELIQEIPTIPADYHGENHCADIHIVENRSLLYASNRGHHSLAAYEILSDGKLAVIDYMSVKGKWPRNFAVVPNGEHLLVANEQTNSIVMMKIKSDGRLRNVGSEYTVKAPVCLQVFEKKK